MMVLEVTPPEIRAFYKPPDAGPNIGGYLGRVFPGGSFLGIDYEQLLALGSGTHEVLADERAREITGTNPPNQTEHELRLDEIRWALFMDRVGACTESEVLMRALLAMTPENVASAVGCLPEDWQEQLQKFAAEIPMRRKRGGVQFFSSAQVTQVPDENLVAVQQWFAGGAE